MLSNPTSFYEKKRTWTMLKLKEYDDFEAKVSEKILKKVKRGQKRVLRVKLDSGVEFQLSNGVTDRVYTRCFVGETITVKAQGFDPKTGLPVRPVFHRVFRKV